jgi:hypothetical protein
MAFHQTGKNVFWLNQTDPTSMLASTHTTTANQFIEAKSIAFSFGDLD